MVNAGKAVYKIIGIWGYVWAVIPLFFCHLHFFLICQLQEKRLKEKASRREARKRNVKVRLLILSLKLHLCL